MEERVAGVKPKLCSPESSDVFGHVPETDKDVCCNRGSL